MEKVVLGIVETQAQAELTAERLQAMGFSAEEVSVVYSDRHGNHDVGFEQHTKAPEGALAGAGIGAVIGAALGMAIGLGLLFVPELGQLVAAGPVLAALCGAAVVALAGALIGAVIGSSVPEIHAKHYAGKVTTGTILVAVHVDSRDELRRAREVLRSVAASDVRTTGEAAIPANARL
jgi:hypothetical protein